MRLAQSERGARGGARAQPECLPASWCERRASGMRLAQSERGARGGARAQPECLPAKMDKSQKALSEFVSESQEAIDLLGRELMQLDDSGGDEPAPDVINSVFRSAHSLKGLSSMFGVERMARLAHALEDLLDAVRMGRRKLDPAAIDLLLETPEVFSRIISEQAAGEPPRSADAAARLAERLRA